MSVRMRVTRAHTGNRRSHHALKEPRLSTCAKCGAHHLRHRMCPDCGNYRDREVVDVVGKKAARLTRREERLKAVGGLPAEHDDKPHNEVVEEKNEKEEKLKTKARASKKTAKTVKKIEAKKEK